MDLPTGALQAFPVLYQRHQIASGAIADDHRHTDIWFGNSFDHMRNNGRNRHDAIDIFGPMGVRVVATTGGHVAKFWRVSGRNIPGLGTTATGDGGYYVVLIDRNTGFYHYYSHLAGPSQLRPGSLVTAGQLVGYLGDSGRARGNPHLHYQVSIRNSHRAASRFLNPYNELRRLAGAGATRSTQNSRVRIQVHSA